MKIMLYLLHMPIIAWITLTILAFIFIFVGLALVIFFAFFANDGKSLPLGIGLSIIGGLLISAILPNYAGSPVIPSTVIAGFSLFAVLGAIAHFFLPIFDNNDAVKAFKPLIFFSIISSLSIAIFNLAKIVAA